MTQDLKIPCETYSRVTGYIRPVSSWNTGKKQEHEERYFITLGKGFESGN